MAGAPRLYDREKLAIDIVEWAKLPDSINLCKFCCTRDIPMAPSTLLRLVDEDSELREAYETAKTFLGARREERLNIGALHVKAYDLNAETYDVFLKDEKRRKSEFESNLRKEEDSNKPQAVNLYVNSDLACGTSLQTKTIPNTPSQSS